MTAITRRRILIAAVLLGLFILGALVKQVSSATEPPSSLIAGSVRHAPAAGSGIVAPEPAGEWVTSTWPPTRYYTERHRADVWAEWAPGNRVWFDSESDLLRAYAGRERR